MQDTHFWISNVCNADLRCLQGFRRFSSEMTLETAIELYEELESRKAAQHGDSSTEKY